MMTKPTITNFKFTREESAHIRGWFKTRETCSICHDKIFRDLLGKKVCFTCNGKIEQKELGGFLDGQ